MPTSKSSSSEPNGAPVAKRDSSARPTVAIIDGDLSVRRALARLIRSFGFAAETFASGREYLEATHPRGVSCLILDLVLDDMNGDDLCACIARDSSPPPPVIVIDSHDERDGGGTRARRAGAVAYLRKPFDASALLGAVERALDR